MSDSEVDSQASKKIKLNTYDQNLDYSQDLNNVQKDIPKVDDYLGNDVMREEVEKLKEFHVLDEVKSNDEDSEAGESDSSEEIPDDEIEKMLEEDLPEGFKGCPKPKEKPYVIRQKIVLEEKGMNPFEILPLDWLMVRHYSGMPVYLHKTTRVCTLSKPYFIGQKGSASRHEIPLSAIPCFNYRRALEEEKKQKEIDRKIAEQIKQMTEAATENASMNKDVNHIDHVARSVEIDDQLLDTSNKTMNMEIDDNIENINDSIVIPADDNFKGESIRNDIINSTDNDLTNNKIQINDDVGNLSNEMDVTVNDVAQEDVVNKILCPFRDTANNANDSRENANDSSENANVIEELPLSSQPVVLPGGIIMPPPRVETVNKNWKTQPLTYEQVNDYCKRLFKFKTINIMHFKRWADRHKYAKIRKSLQYPTLPQGTKLITIPAQPATGQENGVRGGGKANKRDWVMNMNGRSYLCVFHEYVQRALQKQPVYEFKQTENASTPYQATVFIGGMQYGVGYGSSKRQAKSAAARASIHILIPEMKDKLEEEEPAQQTHDEPIFSFFDCVGIEDPRIMEFCASTMEPSPHAILRTCLLRNFGAGDRHIQCDLKKLEYQRIELTMKVGKHSAVVVCKNKKTAKQRASQAILQALHPHVRSWGSLLRLYGSRSVKSCKEKKVEEQQITLLQDKARHNEPNYAVLDKLRQEMTRLKEMDEAVVPIGTLLVTEDLPTHSGSNLNNVDL